ncbi:hypothetical protein PFISCL1PPCAC_11732, partial [Pristionchus fissidentatus]
RLPSLHRADQGYFKPRECPRPRLRFEPRTPNGSTAGYHTTTLLKLSRNRASFSCGSETKDPACKWCSAHAIRTRSSST